MPDPTDKLTQGQTLETVFYRNEGQQKDSFPYRATHINDQKSDKVLLCADRSLPLGQPVRVKVLRVKRPQSPGRGFIEVEYLGPVEFQLDPNIYIDANVSRKLQVLMEAGYSILLDGPQGTGKTVLSEAIARALEMEYVYFNCASAYEATDFVATLQVRANEDGVAETVFVPTNFRKALIEARATAHKRYLVFLDEFNRCRPMARNGLMPALDSTRKVFDPQTGDLLDIPGNVQFIAAINNGSQFVGATAVDPAQMDRFATLKLDYPPEDVECDLLSRRFPLLDRDTLSIVVAVANAVRQEETLGADLSMRATQEACAMLSHPLFQDDLPREEALREAFATAYCGRFPGRPEDQGSEAAMVWRVVLTTLNTLL